MPRARLGAVILSSMLAAGCGDGAPAAFEPTGLAAEPISGGFEDEGDSAVVAFFYAAGGSLCSGSLIAPNVVLTARHCVSPILDTINGGVSCENTTFGELGNAVSFFVTTQSTITLGNAGEHLVREVVGLPPPSDHVCGADLAIMILKDNVDPADAVPLVPRVDEPLVAGDGYSAVGYGAVDDAGSGSGVRRRRDGLFVECGAGECTSYGVEDNEWTGDIGVCSGDSGGPALDEGGRVAGVVSRGTAGCDGPVYGDTYSWKQWLMDTVAYASGLGAYAAPEWTSGSAVDPEHFVEIGEACASTEDCFTGRCLEEGGEAYCTRACTDEAPCPEEFICRAEGEPRVCAKVRPVEPRTAPVAPKEQDESGCAIGAGGRSRGGAWAALALLALALVGRRRAGA